MEGHEVDSYLFTHKIEQHVSVQAAWLLRLLLRTSFQHEFKSFGFFSISK